MLNRETKQLRAPGMCWGGWVTLKVEKPHGKWWQEGGSLSFIPELGQVTVRLWAHPEGDQDLMGGFWTGLTWSDLDFIKTILLLGELSEPRRATPMIIYNDLISPRKHRLTLAGKKLGKVRRALWPHRESSIGDEGVLCVHSFNPLNRPRTAELLLPFYRWRNQEVQRFEDHAAIQWQSWGSKQTVWGQSLRRQKHPRCLKLASHLTIMTRAREENAGPET